MKEKTLENKEKTFVKNVSEIYRRLQLHQQLTMGTICTNIILSACILTMLFGDPIVIMEKEAEKLSFIGQKREVEITQKEIQYVVEKFIRKRYEWDSFSVNGMIDNISPVVTNGLKDKITSEISKQNESFKAISQYVGKVKITVDKDGNVVGVFDKILRITGKLKEGVPNLPGMAEKIPLLSEAQIMVRVVRGTVTDENPLGIYINSIVNYETH